ncbi:heavy metal-associated isoprenylated plant protein 3-like isoform X2 [Phragmites australis]|uniref:heavy metal-associated isoprenylated plant protein 3-like isoform X2 n=1 Tax=Phragmites australis TaxID=29695 RepID=UPI002D798C75|nr:heavy metal-associated isoprenylated plant protein 3-like isoform X2 [Phragmites australis]
MGEEKKASKDGGGDKKKDAGAGPEAAAAPQPIVLNVDLHCAGCASKVRKAIKRAPGVESVAADMAVGKVVVTGAADALELKERIETRAKKHVQIVSAGAGPPKKDKEKDKEKKADGGGGSEKKAEKEKGGGGKKAEKEKGAGDKSKDEKKPKELKEETVTLKIRLHCDGCIDRIKRRIHKIKGVKDVAVDAAKDLVKVTGTMDATALPAYLRDKLSRPVEVVAPGKKDGGGGDKKGDDKKKDGGDKKKDGGSGEEKKDKDKSAAVSASVAPMPLADAGMYQMPPHYGYTPYPPAPGSYYGGAAPPPNPALYPNAGGAQYLPPQPYPYAAHVHVHQMFSDENPNACSVM